MWEIYIEIRSYFLLEAKLKQRTGPVWFFISNLIRFRDFGFVACDFRFLEGIFPPDFLGVLTIGRAKVFGQI